MQTLLRIMLTFNCTSKSVDFQSWKDKWCGYKKQRKNKMDVQILAYCSYPDLSFLYCAEGKLE